MKQNKRHVALTSKGDKDDKKILNKIVKKIFDEIV